MRLLVFGSRTFSAKDFLFEVLDTFVAAGVGPETVIEGEAPGADSLGREWAEARGIEVIKFPADWEKYGRAAGPIRNKQMLVEGEPTWGIGFIDKDFDLSRGTKNMTRQLLKAGIPVEIHRPGYTSWP